YDPSIQCTSYDPVGARKLVAQSGIPNPTVQMLVPSSVQDVTMAEFIQAEEQAVGINLVVTPVDLATLTSSAGSGNYQTILAESTPVKADPDWLYVNFLSPTGQPNTSTGYSSPRLTIVLRNSRRSVSENARQTYFRVAQQTLLADRPVIYLVHVVE